MASCEPAGCCVGLPICYIPLPPLPFASALESSHSQEFPGKVRDPNELRVKLFRTKELRTSFRPGRPCCSSWMHCFCFGDYEASLQ